MSTIARITGTAIAAVLALGALTACSSDATPAPVETTTAATQAPAPTATTQPAPVETTPAEPEVVADEFSAVVDGVLYQGTEKAPVRIGSDTPGLAPALDAEVPDQMTSGDGFVGTLESAIDVGGKYVVLVGPALNGQNEREGWYWGVWSRNAYGNVKAIETSPTFATADAAAADPFTLDGRVLDRAEYVVIVVPS